MKQSIPTHLAVPEREPVGTGSFDYRPRTVENWLQNLPVTNLGIVSRTIYESLQASNRLQLHPGMRLRYLEQLREIVRYISDGLRKQYLGRELPLHLKAKRIVLLATRLLQEMALGYEVLIETAHEYRGLSFGHRHLACALDRAIRYRSRILLESWIVYQPPPAGSWRRLHDLYAIAEETGLSEQRVTDSQLAGTRQRSTPGQAYRQVLLLAAAGPQRMHHSEILESYRLFERWAAAARLVAVGDPAASEALFRVPRALDEPPQPLAIGARGSQDRLLITDPLQRLIESEFATATKRAFWHRKPLIDVHPEFAERLLLALGATAGRRRQARLRVKADVQAALGLTAIHRTLCRELGQDSEAVDSVYERFQARETHSLDCEEPDIWHLIYPTELIKAVAEEQRQRKLDVRHPLHQEELLDWNLIDISAGGYCLVLGPQQNLRARVGELIAVRELAGQELSWQLGAIRWMRATSEQRLQIGVQLLAPNPSPIQLRAEHADYRFGPVERGLLLPAVTAIDQPATLIAPGRHYATQQCVRVRYGLRETMVELSRELDATAHYVQFEFRRSDALDMRTAALDDIVPIS